MFHLEVDLTAEQLFLVAKTLRDNDAAFLDQENLPSNSMIVLGEKNPEAEQYREQCIALAKKLAQFGKRAAVLSVLKTFKLDRVSAVPDNQAEAVFHALEEIDNAD
ncbi:MAG: hypothetical protein LBB67_06075 [Oscillospiraceae bacterium]|jgi:hypothetical protein|nr:hypothetical protein [Oscillospiraceae bacterium]